MQLVIADTGPINYLIMIGQIDVLPALFQKIVLPSAVSSELNADLLLMDDRAGVQAARRLGIEVTGTLGVLSLAAKSDLLDLAEAFSRIKLTNFRYRQETMEALLARNRGD